MTLLGSSSFLPLLTTTILSESSVAPDARGEDAVAPDARGIAFDAPIEVTFVRHCCYHRKNTFTPCRLIACSLRGM